MDPLYAQNAPLKISAGFSGGAGPGVAADGGYLDPKEQQGARKDSPAAPEGYLTLEALHAHGAESTTDDQEVCVCVCVCVCLCVSVCVCVCVPAYSHKRACAFAPNRVRRTSRSSRGASHRERNIPTCTVNLRCLCARDSRTTKVSFVKWVVLINTGFPPLCDRAKEKKKTSVRPLAILHPTKGTRTTSSITESSRKKKRKEETKKKEERRKTRGGPIDQSLMHTSRQRGCLRQKKGAVLIAARVQRHGWSCGHVAP
jgi:hypothetical protein